MGALKHHPCLSSAILLGIAVIWRALSIIFSLSVQVSMVGEGPRRLEGGGSPGPKVELGFFALCTLVGFSHPNGMLWPY